MSQRRIYKNQLKRLNNSSLSSAPNTSHEINSLMEMFPDWDADDLSGLLEEHNNILEIVIDLIVNNKVSKWEPIKKEPKTKKKDKESENGPNSVNNNNTSVNASANVSSGSDNAHKQNRHTKDTHSYNNKSKFASGKPHHANRKGQYPKHTGKDQAQTSAGASSTTHTTMTSTTPAVPANSWAAALSSKNKQRPHPETNKATASKQEKVKDSGRKGGNEDEASEDKVVIEETSIVETAPQNEHKGLVLKEASVPQPKQGSWASAITPKRKPKPQGRRRSHASDQPQQVTKEQEETVEASGDSAVKVEKELTITPSGEKETISKTTTGAEQSQSQPQSEVVLPNPQPPLESVGVSFGSLSLGEDEQELGKMNEIREQEPQLPHQHYPSQQPTVPTQPPVNNTQQAPHQAPQVSAAAQAPHQIPPQVLQQQGQDYSFYNNPNRYNQQFYQQSPYPKPKQQQQQQFDYYNQLQNRQYPQPSAQTLPGNQFGVYPGMDYSPYTQQALAAAGSPATGAGMTYGHFGHMVGQPGATAAANENVAAHSPVVNPATLQQQMPTAPFGYPYYNYYTPMYGNGMGMGMTQTGLGNVSQGANNNPEANENANGIAGPDFVGVGGGASQYYTQPSQAPKYAYGYPQTSQPNAATGNRPAGQSNRASQSNEASETAAANPSAVPQQPIHPMVPQFGVYQQYPQYGGYQTSSQYRGWY